jgi:AraC family transcriptional regulator of adaptative response / DNA-3-methyladenine glycosylase II
MHTSQPAAIADGATGTRVASSTPNAFSTPSSPSTPSTPSAPVKSRTTGSHAIRGPHGPRCTLGDPLFAERYRAIDARDTRFDGQFFTAVSSTGIYCRPSCPARTPSPGNVAFYLTSAAAHEAGYRACKRCLPEATPGTPEWDLRRDLAGRAMRLITDGVVDREGVDGLAARLGYTSRHVHRLLLAELGAGPLALARARRAQTARALLVGSDLPLAQVAFAAGFGSVRQFNDTIQEVFAARPGELRGIVANKVTTGDVPPRDEATARWMSPDPDAPGLAPMAPVQLTVDLPVRQPFDAAGIFGFLAVRAVAGVEVADLTDPTRLRYARTLTLPHGPAAIDVTAVRTTVARRTAGAVPRSAPIAWQLSVRLELTSLADIAPAVARVRRLLDLDSDPVAVDAALSTDPHLAPLVERTPGIRVPGAVDPHELVIRAIIGQQISVAAARTHLSRLAERAGTPYASAIPGLTRLFPTTAQIIEYVPEPAQPERPARPAQPPQRVATDPAPDPDRPLRLPAQSVRAILATARALDTGDLEVHVGVDADQLRARLLERPRIGPWTAAYIAMRVLGDPDAWLAGDVALVAGAKATGVLDRTLSASASHQHLIRHADAWAPWRSYAAMHLWQAAATPGGTP